MKKIIAFLSCTLAIVAGTSCTDEANNSDYDDMFPFGKEEQSYTYPKNDGCMRILSYNIRHCGGSEDADGVSYERVANIITSLYPDVVCLQEVDHLNSRTDYANQTEKLAALTEMTGYFCKSIDYQGGEYGNAILCSQTPISEYKLELPFSDEYRSAHFLEFEDYVVVSAHLSSVDGANTLSAPLITAQAKTYNKLVYLAGDFNESNVNSDCFKAFLTDWTIDSNTLMGTTVSGGSTGSCLDYILTLNGYAAAPTANNVIYHLDGADMATSSDHYPIYVDYYVGTTMPELEEDQLRIMNYNLRLYNYPMSSIMTEIVSGLNADVACFQFVHRNTTTNESNDMLADVIEGSGLDYCYFSRAHETEGGYKSGDFGVAIASKVEAISTEIDAYDFDEDSTTNERRPYVIAEFEDFVIVSTYFDTDATYWQTMYDGIKEKLAAYGKPALLSCCFNLRPTSMSPVYEHYTALSADLVDENKASGGYRMHYIVHLTGTGDVVCSNASVQSTYNGVEMYSSFADAYYCPVYIDVSF